MLAVGLLTLNTSVVVNASLALAVTALPAVLERDYRIPLDAGLTLWITSAVFLHTLGMYGLYDGIWWWDHLTHTLSVTMVAAVGYVTARAVDIHSDDIYLPPQFLFVYVILFTLALGVFWEVLEFAVRVGADVLGFDPVLIQYGLSDSLLDLVFNTVGAVVVGLFAAGLFSGVVDSLVERPDTVWPAATDEWRGDELASARLPLDDVLTASPSNALRAWMLTGGLPLVVAVALVDGKRCGRRSRR